MSEPLTEAGRGWLANVRGVGGPAERVADRIVAIEAQAVEAWLQSPEAEARLAVALAIHRSTITDSIVGGLHFPSDALVRSILVALRTPTP